MVSVTLSWSEMIVAGNAGVLRQVNALRRKLTSLDAHHFDSQEGHVSGAIAEWAVCKWLGINWDPAVGVTHASQVAGDAGRIEVRSTCLAHGKLICHDYSFDDRPYLLVLSHRAPEFLLAGWLMGREAKSPCYWNPNAPRPAFFVPQADLEPAASLPGAGL